MPTATAVSLLSLLTDFEKNPLGRKYTDGAYDLPGYARWLHGLGLPGAQTPWIHVAGTKGKGSTCALIESILHAAGHRTALYTSPHLAHYGERIRLNTLDRSPVEFDAIRQAFEAEIGYHGSATVPQHLNGRTHFEVLTALFFRFCEQERVGVAVLETGLGGRLDCTNVVEPAVTAITSIGLDHVKILGSTVEAIASEKAGIIKFARPVVVFNAGDDESARAREVIVARAAELAAPVLAPVPVRLLESTAFGSEVEFKWSGEPVRARLPLVGVHQVSNLGIALAAVSAFAPHHILPTGDAAVRGIESVRWPGRLEVLPGSPALLLDGAHCPLSARTLARALPLVAAVALPPYTLLWGMQSDKDHAGFLGGLEEAPIARVICYPVAGGRGATVEQLTAAAVGVGLPVIPADSPQSAFSQGAAFGDTLLAAGTLYTLAAFRRLHEARPRGPGTLE